MVHSKVTSKGQTTVPRQVREALSVEPGDHITYEVKGDHAVIRREPGLESIFGILKGKGRRPVASFKAGGRAARQAWTARTTGRGSPDADAP